MVLLSLRVTGRTVNCRVITVFTKSLMGNHEEPRMNLHNIFAQNVFDFFIGLFQLAKKVTGKKPMTMITDGLPAYNDAYKKEFRTLRKPRTEHIRHIKLKGDMNNDKMERLNGEIRQREKTMR